MTSTIIIIAVGVVLAVWGFRVSGDKANTSSARWLGALVAVAGLAAALLVTYPLVRFILPRL